MSDSLDDRYPRTTAGCSGLVLGAILGFVIGVAVGAGPSNMDVEPPKPQENRPISQNTVNSDK